ncbi:MAG: hypothetical protein AAFY50_16225 [Cyanobacteria bacterium J06648_1]
MNKTIELPSGKIIDLNRFVALVPEHKAANNEYNLILEGCTQAIPLNSQEVISVKEHLKMNLVDDQAKSSSLNLATTLSNSKHDNNISWDREEQIRKNQPAIELLKKRIARNKLMSEEESDQRAEFFTDFQKTVDEQRVSERKLYSLE